VECAGRQEICESLVIIGVDTLRRDPLFHEFLRVLQVSPVPDPNLDYPRRNHRYSLTQMILALMDPLVHGLDRLETASFLRFNGTLQYLTRLPGFPDPQTLRRFLLHAPDSFWEQMPEEASGLSPLHSLDGFFARGIEQFGREMLQAVQSRPLPARRWPKRTNRCLE
jgi:hypothetical protein